jgi:putative ABC transport system permease protein
MWRSATPDYFRAIGIDLKRGRMFDDGDRRGSPLVTVVSESFAARMWPDADPIGQRVQSGFSHEWLTVVGVVEEARMFGVIGPNTPVMYVPLAQAPLVGPAQVLVLRSSVAAESLVPTVRRMVQGLDPRVAVTRPGPLRSVVSTALAEPLRLRFFLMLFAALALALGSVGVYGVVSYAVTRRRAEFGIRMALGAAPVDVLRIVVRHGMAPVALGVAGGLAGSLALARLVDRFLYGVTATDPASLGLAAVVLLGAGMLAAIVPAIRAGRVNPVEALRAE